VCDQSHGAHIESILNVILGSNVNSTVINLVIRKALDYHPNLGSLNPILIDTNKTKLSRGDLPLNGVKEWSKQF
jgi:hypothetical protein